MSFLLGCIAHIATDSAWNRLILAPLVERYPNEYQHNKAAFFSAVKRGWCDLDFLYLKEHPDYEPLRRYLAIPDMTNVWMDIFTPDAFSLRRDFIRTFYTDGIRTVVQRPMTYLTATELDAFVPAAANTVIDEHHSLFAHCSDSAK